MELPPPPPLMMKKKPKTNPPQWFELFKIKISPSLRGENTKAATGQPVILLKCELLHMFVLIALMNFTK